MLFSRILINAGLYLLLIPNVFIRKYVFNYPIEYETAFNFAQNGRQIVQQITFWRAVVPVDNNAFATTSIEQRTIVLLKIKSNNYDIMTALL